MVFDIRIIGRINYASQIIYIRFIGTHRQYDQIDANEV
jgi:mRNA-degrading endonuclease HigB of HigAB toxin-antitoxin module